MNTAEIRRDFYSRIKTIEYDRTITNDALSFQWLTDKKNYRPLGQRFRLIPLPMYARDGDWSFTTAKTYLARLVGGGVLLWAGYKFGSWDSKDELLANHKVVWFESEE